MNRVAEWLFPTEERRIVGWFAAAAALTGLLTGVLVYAQPSIDEALVLWLPGEATWWYAGFAVACFFLTYGFVRLSRRRGGPVSVWLVPAFAAVWTAIGPLLDDVLSPGTQSLARPAVWWNLLPLAAVLAPALIATVQENEPGAPFLPAEERRAALAVGWLTLALFAANKVAFTSPRWADAWLPAMRDDEELGYQLLVVTFVPLVVCFLGVLAFKVQRSAWAVPSVAALVVAFATGLPGTLAGPEFAGSLTFVLLTLPMCLMAFLGSILGAALTPRRRVGAD